MATAESFAPVPLREMLLAAQSADIVYTLAVSGVPGNFLRASLITAGRDPDNPTPPEHYDFGTTEAKAWRDIWAAGHGVGAIDDLPPVGERVNRLATEMRSALQSEAKG